MVVIAVPVLAVIGMAVDYTRANAARTAFQVSLDASASKPLHRTGVITSFLGVIGVSQIDIKCERGFDLGQHAPAGRLCPRQRWFDGECRQDGRA